MTLKKFIHIQNVGRFQNYESRGDIEFRQFNIIYAENGMGKTTLSHILRSLATNEAGYIEERNTLGSKAEPKIRVLCESGSIDFKDGSWSQNQSNIEIFDSTFVNENVFSGHYVDVGHRRNLYLFVIGERGVQLSQQITDLTDLIKSTQREINDKRSDIELAIRGLDITVEKFVDLQHIIDIYKQVAAQEREVGALKQAEQLISARQLLPINVPTVDNVELIELLVTKLDDLSSEAIKHVQNHLAQIGVENEHWINQGTNLLQDETCPYCGQLISGLELVEAYRGFFGMSYEFLKERIQLYKDDLRNELRDTELFQLTNQVSDNADLWNYWKQFLDQPIILSLDIEELQSIWRTFRKELVSLLDRKSNAPLENIGLSESYLQAYDDHKRLILNVERYNDSLLQINNLIDRLKAQVSTGDLSIAQQKLQFLNAVRIRFEPQVIATCDVYNQAANEKSQLEAEKKRLQQELRDFTAAMMEKYENNLNRYLDIFGASFRIKQSRKPKMESGIPSTDYVIELDEQEMSLGKPNEMIGAPTFRSLLSEGDKNTLAFAFFMARLGTMSETQLAEKVVVFDDPISSLDDHRKTATQQQIVNLANHTKQVFVLSHDPYYLRMVWEGYERAKTRVLHLIRVGDKQSSIQEWDIESATRALYFRNYDILIGYLRDGPTKFNLYEVVKCIRPLLEANMRLRFPSEFAHNEWLGDFITKVSEATPSDVVFPAKILLADLTEINDFCKHYHHDDPSVIRPALSDTELNSYVKRTTKLLGGIFQIEIS